MKKSTLALSIAAAIGGLGMVSNALAITTVSGAATGSVIARNDNGIGHQLVFPYFTAQNGNATLLSITNTDTTNGKLVKVRFRGAANSDDLYDFQVAMSPGDVWTASVTKDATTGAATLATSDVSCTVPAKLGGPFSALRLDGAAVSQTLEGYVEVINMADIKNVAAPGQTAATSQLFAAIKHVKGVAPCTTSVISDSLGTDPADATAANNRGLYAPTTGLTGDWIILNQATTAAWSGSATALQVNAGAADTTPVAGNIVFFPQILGDVTSASNYTADPLITSGVLKAQFYDLPDMSTPYSANGTNAATQADVSTAAIAVKSVANQYVTDTGIAAVTDILFSQPLRRYSAAVNYKASTVTDANGNTLQVPLATNGTVATALYRGAAATALTSTTLNNVVYKVAATAADLVTAVGTGSAYYGPSSATSGSTARNLAFATGTRILCLNTISAPAQNTIFDREETTPGSSSSTSTASFVISPNTSTTTTSTAVYVCGEAAVISINNGGTTGNSALSASIARSDFTSTSLTTYVNGWVYFNTAATGNTIGLPIIGQSFIRMANGAVNYGVGYANKVTR
jgi:hypothetical protein